MTATPPRIPAPVYETTPPVVYVLGMYCKIRFLGTGSEIITAARKYER